MPQAAPLTSPRLPILLLALAFPLVPWPASAAEIESVYTKLDLKLCKDVTPEDVKDYGSVSICPGHDGIDVRVAEGDLRIFVSYGANAANQTATYETIPQFNTIGETLEWRVKREGDKLKPFATILRFSWDVDGKKGSTLVVTKLGKDDACHMAYVAASGIRRRTRRPAPSPTGMPGPSPASRTAPSTTVAEPNKTSRGTVAAQWSNAGSPWID